MFSRDNPLSFDLINEFRLVALNRQRKGAPSTNESGITFGSAPGSGAPEPEVDFDAWGSDFEDEPEKRGALNESLSTPRNWALGHKNNQGEDEEYYEPVEGQVRA
jgi:hypothetical protein